MTVEKLSSRELQVLGLLGRALSIKGVARELGISPGTTKWHVRNLYLKLDVSSREHALSKARACAIIP